MKKSSKARVDRRAYYFLLLIIITALGVVYTMTKPYAQKIPIGRASDNDSNEDEISTHEITAEISGAVNNPGIYALTTGDDVGVLVEMAEGFTDGANTDKLDLSAAVFNMQEIVVGEQTEPPVSRYSEIITDMYYPPTEKEKELVSESLKININIATSEQLQRLPGIGEKLAESIIAYRRENSGFKTTDEIMNVPKIGEKKYEALAPYITVDAK